jgi:hypothetical protein
VNFLRQQIGVIKHIAGKGHYLPSCNWLNAIQQTPLTKSSGPFGTALGFAVGF